MSLMIDMQMAQDSVAMVERHGEAGVKALVGVRQGLARGLTTIVNYIQTKLLIGGNHTSKRDGALPLAARSRALLRSIDSEMTGPLSGRFGSIVGDASAYAGVQLLDETTVIKPKSGKVLSIPMGKNLNASGIARFDSPRDAADHYGQDGSWITAKTGALVYFQPTGGTYQRAVKKAGAVKGDAKGEILFFGAPRVTIKGTGALRHAHEQKREYILGLIAQGATSGFGGAA